MALNRETIAAMGMVRGVTHAEFIRSHADGEFCFLEIAARVGGANIDRMIEAASGINLWAEWGRLELAHLAGQEYEPPLSPEVVVTGVGEVDDSATRVIDALLALERAT